MEPTDWRTLSLTYITTTVTNAIAQQHIDTIFKPTLLIAACEDALGIGRILRAEVKARSGQLVPLLNSRLELFNDQNPYNEHYAKWEGQFSGQRVLLVDKADNTRASIAGFIDKLKQGPFSSEQAASPDSWVEPELGVFVLHNKRRHKEARLPDGVQEFVGQEVENVHLAYATSGSFTNGEDQPQAQHSNSSGSMPKPPSTRAADPSRRHPARPASPLPTATGDVLHIVSSHFVETLLEKAVEEQQLQERFGPTMLVAASDGALAVARLLRQYLRHRSGHQPRPADQQPPVHHELPLLTPRLELYDEDINPYLAHIRGAKAWGPASLAGQHVLVVDRADNTRTTLAAFITKLKEAAAGARAEAEAQGLPWAGEPVIGVFVLHNKQVDKQGDLPQDILNGRYFYGEVTDGSTVLYPFNV